MGQNIVIVQPPQTQKQGQIPVVSERPPVLEWILIGLLVILLVVVGAIAMRKPPCTGSDCATAGGRESLETYMLRCTEEDRFSPVYCAEMWERVKGTRGRS